ncbi:MAG: PilC/PilY family type IV pilus protein [Pseudomonas sp.]
MSALAALAAIGASSYFLYSAYSTQGAGELAQAPMNIETPVTPAFVMAVDDSNSMVFERIFPGGDMRFSWNSSTRTFFYDGSLDAGESRCSQNGSGCGTYHFLFPHDGYNEAYGSYAIPPLDGFGFARSPVYNKGYFNPATTYLPWLRPNGKDRWPNASIAATRADPRDPQEYGSRFSAGYNVTYDMTANRTRTDETFRMLAGMNIPDLSDRGMRYRSGRSWATAARSVNSAANMAFDYFPATFYLPVDDPAPEGFKVGDQYRPVVENACGPGCSLRRYEIKPENYLSGYDDAIQNFANWFQYHRNRLLAMVGSMTESMASVNTMRVGYFTINDRVDVTMYDMGVEADKEALYAQILKLQANGLLVDRGGATPNRSAVAWLGQQFKRTDDEAPVQLACQKNAGMLFTDGYTNSSDKPEAYGNADGAMGAPFADSYSNTIADIAASYYSGANVPLRSGNGFVGGVVKVPEQCASLGKDSADWKRLDCQVNLHMNFYGIVLGAQGRIYGNDVAATADPYASAPVWSPDPTSVDDGAAVDEIWHGVINARGEFVNAQTPAEVTAAMRRILSLSGDGNSPSGSISLTGSRIGSGSFSVTPVYRAGNNGTDWYSELKAQFISTHAVTREVQYETLWEASARLPAATDRNIYFGASGGASPFNSSNLALADLCSDNLSRCSASTIRSELNVSLDQAIAYLRGDQTLEASRDTPLRTRTTRLGDIVNSTPVISAPSDDYGYTSIYDHTTGKYDPYGYAAFLKTKARNRANMVYVGANDGMLHAFDGGTGVEKFAYVPQSVLGHMGNLLFPYRAEDKDDQVFQHRYYVDGPITVADIANGNDDWMSVLVGTSGAGGKGVFALDVSDPDSFVGSSRLWELNDSSDDADIANNIGNVLGKPVIVPVRSTAGSVSWKAIFGNGYGSINGKAMLFVVDIMSGRVTLIPAQESGVAGSNGLGNIVVLDRWSGSDLSVAARDGYADTVYAADQKGAVWKFDLRSVTADPAATRLLDAVTTPLFVAADDEGNRQPILGGLQAAAGPGGGVMLYFGTGAFSFKSDAIDNSQQTLYGVLDRGVSMTLGRANLLEQKIITTASGVRTTTRYSMPVGKLGWYIDLASTGERFVGNPEIESGIVFFPTFDPSSTDACSTVGANWLYGLNALNGAAALSGVRIGSLTGDSHAVGTGAIALSSTGSAPVKDVAVMTMARGALLAPEATKADLENALLSQCSMVIQVSGASPLYMPRACGRQSWRQIK